MNLTPENLSICGICCIVFGFVISMIIAAYDFKEIQLDPPIPTPLSDPQITELYKRNDTALLALLQKEANTTGYLIPDRIFQTIAEESVKQETHEKRMATN